jgi:hypothetical protein
LGISEQRRVAAKQRATSPGAKQSRLALDKLFIGEMLSSGRTNEEHPMAASSKFMNTEAERRFPVRIRIGLPPSGLGRRLTEMQAWLDENFGAGAWAITLAGTRDVLNDALSIYFADAALARFCRPMVCRRQGRDYRGRVPGARG